MRLISPSRVAIVPVDSRVLRGNPLRDPWRRELPVVLPPGYDEEPRRRYPVLFVLAGFLGAGRMLLNRSMSSPAIDERLARLVARRAMPPAILALPDCMTSLGGSQYVDSPAVGRYETHVCDELVPLLDARFRTIPKRESRGVLGKSSGGYGALRIAMRRPDLFAAAGSHSGDCYFEYCHLHDFPAAVNALRSAGGVRGLLRRIRATEKPKHDDTIALMVVAAAACYSPNPRAPLGIDLPFDTTTGAIRKAVFERWLRWDPVRMVERPKHAKALRQLRCLFLDCGARDQWALHLGLRVLCERLERKRIRFVHEEFDDDHMSISYRFDRSLPLLVKSLER